jgi:hypothetical protein|eukprot:COSAG01_NODE_257_length_20101_cov_142.726427_4_plen_81_part_00
MRRRFSTGALTAAENDEAFWLGGGVPLGFQYSSNTNTGAALSAPFHHSEIAACIVLPPTDIKLQIAISGVVTRLPVQGGG